MYLTLTISIIVSVKAGSQLQGTHWDSPRYRIEAREKSKLKWSNSGPGAMWKMKQTLKPWRNQKAYLNYFTWSSPYCISWKKPVLPSLWVLLLCNAKCGTKGSWFKVKCKDEKVAWSYLWSVIGMNVSFPFSFWLMCCCSPVGEVLSAMLWRAHGPFPGSWSCLQLGQHLGHRTVLPFYQPPPGLVSTARGHKMRRFADSVHWRNRCVPGYLGAWVISAIKMWVPWLKGLMRQPKWEHFQKSDFCNYSGFH